MKLTSSMRSGWEGLLAGLFLTVLGAVLALPSLWNAWWHDPYSSGGFPAFLVWLSSLGIASWRLRPVRGEGNTLWIVLSALLCVVGSISSLRVCHHLALACALCAWTVPAKHGWIAAAAALSWLPATGWLISRLHTGGVAEWQRPTLAATAAIVWLLFLQRKTSNSNG